MEGIPFDFIIFLILGFMVAVAIVIGVALWRQRNMHRLKDPSRDHYTKRSKRG